MIKQLLKITILFLVIVFFTNISVANMVDTVNSIAKKYRIDTKDVGIAVQRTKNDLWYYRKNSKELFIPASNNKVLTAISSFLVLDKNFRFTTTVYVNLNQLKNKTLNGNLYIEFTGDPTLTTSALNSLIKKIKKRITKINGDVVIVANHFSGDYIPEGWYDEDLGKCFAPAVSSLNMNRNCMFVRLKSSGKTNTTVQRRINTQHIGIENKTHMFSNVYSHNCSFNTQMTDRNILKLSGCLPFRGSYDFSFAINNPGLKGLDTLKDLLKNSKIKYQKILFGNLPNISKFTDIGRLSSQSLDYLITYMLQHSDNLYAESFMRTLGHKIYGVGSIDSGTKAIKNIIKTKLKVNTKNIVIKDGSGLSALDRVTPSFMANLLTAAFNSSIGKRFNNSLSVSGISGTLGNRLSRTLFNRVRGKTGTLADVVSLTGYVMTKKGKRYSFAIFVNGINKSQRTSSRMFIDDVLRAIHKTY